MDATGAESAGGRGEATETLWRIYGELNEWIRFADAKAGAILAADIVIATSAVALLRESGWPPSGGLAWAVAILVGLAGLAFIASAACCLGCIRPRTSPPPAGSPRLIPLLKALWPHTRTPGDSLIYFGHVAEIDTPADYAAKARAFDRLEAAYGQIAAQVWVNARIADRKHDAVAWAVHLLGYGLALAFAAWCLSLG